MSFGALEVRERLQSAGFNVRRTDLREHVSVSSHRDDQTHTPCPAGPSGGPPSDFVFPARRPLNVLLSAVSGHRATRPQPVRHRFWSLDPGAGAEASRLVTRGEPVTVASNDSHEIRAF